jgi:hypothetical protein
MTINARTGPLAFAPSPSARGPITPPTGNPQRTCAAHFPGRAEVRHDGGPRVLGQVSGRRLQDPRGDGGSPRGFPA